MPDISVEGFPLEEFLEKIHQLAYQRDADPDEFNEAYWDWIYAMSRSTQDAAFEQAIAWCRSSAPVERELGADALAFIHRGYDPKTRDSIRPHAAQAIEVLIPILKDNNWDVVASVINSLWHNRLEDGFILLPFIAHESARIRLEMTHALIHVGNRGAPQMIAALISLMEDTDDDVRDWATFGLHQLGVDSPAVRDAFFNRLTDPSLNVQGEAMVGLALLKDQRVKERLSAELEGDEVHDDFVFDAAREFEDPDLLPALYDWLEFLPDGFALQWAIEELEAIGKNG